MSSRRRRTRFVHLLAAALMLGITFAAGRAPANVQEQRARLPPPATDCRDPVEGVWMSHSYYPNNGQWYIFTLTVRRKSPGSSELTGDIRSEYWDGEEADANPPPCRLGGMHQRVFMTARGSVIGQNIRFGGTAWRMDAVLCGPSGASYNLDQFSGQIDPNILEFQSVNNDGGLAVNEPTVFRRIRCIDPASAPHVEVKPPPFQPPGRSFGCGC